MFSQQHTESGQHHLLYVSVCSAHPTMLDSSLTSITIGTLPPPVHIRLLNVWQISFSIIRTLESAGWFSSGMNFNNCHSSLVAIWIIDH